MFATQEARDLIDDDTAHPYTWEMESIYDTAENLMSQDKALNRETAYLVASKIVMSELDDQRARAMKMVDCELTEALIDNLVMAAKAIGR